jgi:hypothetical protein
VGCAAKARVIGAESHFNHIQQAFVDNRPFLDQAGAAFLMDMLMGA